MPKNENKPQSVQIQAEAYDVLGKLSTLMSGAGLGAINSRLLLWFEKLDRKMQIAILTGDEPAQREFSRMALRELAGMNEETPDLVGPALSFEECQRVIVKMLDRMNHLHQQTENALGNALKKRK